MARLNIERQQQLEPKRMDHAIKKITELGYIIEGQTERSMRFKFKGQLVYYFPYSGWHTGQSITDGRGFKNLLKQIVTTILLMLTISGMAQYINLDWPRANVKAQNRDKELIWSGRDYLEYKVTGGYIAYEFADRICTASFICLDSIAGDSLIRSHLYKNWQPIAPDKWLYYAGYDEPVKVSADWCGGSVLFCYTLKD